GAVAFLMVAGWQVGTDGLFADNNSAIELAIAHSGGPGATVQCRDSEQVGSGPYRGRVCVKAMKAFCDFEDHGIYSLGTCNF
ncbi:hypothetical protein, partial [Lunatimonas lonarensis]